MPDLANPKTSLAEGSTQKHRGCAASVFIMLPTMRADALDRLFFFSIDAPTGVEQDKAPTRPFSVKLCGAN